MCQLLGDCTNVTGPNGCAASAAFAGDANHEDSADTKSITLAKATATISVSGYTGAYDGAAHGASGSATGVANENLGALLSLGVSFTNVPGGTANWSFAGNGNYYPANNSVAITINQASLTVHVTAASVVFTGSA